MKKTSGWFRKRQEHNILTGMEQNRKAGRMESGKILSALVVLAAVAQLGVLCGCAGYRLGTLLPPDIKTIHVPTFVNQTREPGLEAETTGAAIAEFQKDGTLKITGAERADVILTAVLIGYKLEPLRYDRDNAKTTSEYRLTIKANIVLTRGATGEIMFEREIAGESTFEPAGDLTSAKVEALPEASRDLAHDIVESVVEYW